MSYYKSTLVTTCCGNYNCHTCGVRYVTSKYSLHLKSHNSLIVPMDYVNCAHCMTGVGRDVGMYRSLGEGEKVRSYKDDKMASPTYLRGAYEKVEIGDGWDTLKRKMINFGKREGGESETEKGESDTEGSFEFIDDLSEGEGSELETSVAEEVWKGIVQGVAIRRGVGVGC